MNTYDLYILFSASSLRLTVKNSTIHTYTTIRTLTKYLSCYLLFTKCQTQLFKKCRTIISRIQLQIHFSGLRWIIHLIHKIKDELRFSTICTQSLSQNKNFFTKYPNLHSLSKQSRRIYSFKQL